MGKMASDCYHFQNVVEAVLHLACQLPQFLLLTKIMMKLPLNAYTWKNDTKYQF